MRSADASSAGSAPSSPGSDATGPSPASPPEPEPGGQAPTAGPAGAEPNASVPADAGGDARDEGAGDRKGRCFVFSIANTTSGQAAKDLLEWYEADALFFQEHKFRDDVLMQSEAYARNRGWKLALGNSLPGAGGARRAGTAVAVRSYLGVDL